MPVSEAILYALATTVVVVFIGAIIIRIADETSKDWNKD